MKDNIKMVLVLTSIALMSALVLTGVYEFTAPIIEGHAQEAIARSISEVLGQIEDMEVLEIEGKEVYKAYRNGELVAAVITEASGYGGAIQVMVGMNLEEEKILHINVLEHRETPGIGTVIEEENFTKRFAGLAFKDSYRQDVDIISGATVSTRAVITAVERAVEFIQKHLGDEIQLENRGDL